MNRNIINIEQPESNILVLTILDTGKPRRLLITSDHHVDNAKSLHWLIKQDLGEAMHTNSDIYMFGDTLDAMDSNTDPRSVKGQTRDENVGADYTDRLVNNAFKLYGAFRNNIVGISNGNHETAYVKRKETDLIKRLVDKLRFDNAKVHNLPYWGWVIYHFVDKDGKETRKPFKMYFHHGHGGGGEVTKGMIQMQRKAAILEGADVVVMGHVHEAVYAEWWKSVVDYNNKAYKNMIKPVTMIRSATYKQEYVDNGFHVIKGRPPKPLGGWWLELIPHGEHTYIKTFRTFVPWWELKVGNDRPIYDDEFMSHWTKEWDQYGEHSGRDY